MYFYTLFWVFQHLKHPPVTALWWCACCCCWWWCYRMMIEWQREMPWHQTTIRTCPVPLRTIRMSPSLIAVVKKVLSFIVCVLLIVLLLASVVIYWDCVSTNGLRLGEAMSHIKLGGWRHLVEKLHQMVSKICVQNRTLGWQKIVKITCHLVI